ncbi:hypothetical protein KBX71_20030 [Micromonospora sp. D93]|uniref:hypothetical protein n=1 Tax=Micromonospora sp. D93 TaxID=2824886 RepID=UPI001B35E411|nr:hypothetical protein [Micromonospora sp. D93]MBQ1020140.1 hypothetical protein [Micromonospora sp. D93]
MRPLLIAETVMPPPTFVEWLTGAGLLAWSPRSLHVLNSDLTVALAWEPSDDYRMHESAAVVSDDWVMVGFATDQGDAEQHLLLSTRTLRPQTIMDYGIDMPQNSIRPIGGRGQWMTHDARTGVVRIWQLREPHTDEVEGQLTLL